MSVNTNTAESIAAWSQEASEPAWLTQQRMTAWQQYQQLPTPPRVAEAWKYTNLEQVAGWDVTQCSTGAATTTLTGAAPALIACDFATALKEHGSLVRPYLDAMAQQQFSSVGKTPYGGLRYLRQHDALWDRGYFIYVPKNVTISAPLMSSITCQAVGTACFPRTVIVLEAGASLTYVEDLRSAGLDAGAVTSCHARTELYLGAGSRLQYATVQHWHAGMRYLAQQHAALQQDARLTAINITLGGQVVKCVNETALMAPGAEAQLFGLTFGDGTQHVDHHTMQTHYAPHTTSDLLYKTALKDHAKSIYTGLIHMSPAAVQGCAYQANRNLLLSETSVANSIPQLEIEVNDVKCSHGATMGSVDAEQLYYLMSRGLSRPVAEQMIVAGFFEDVLLRLPDPQVQASVREAVTRKLGH